MSTLPILKCTLDLLRPGNSSSISEPAPTCPQLEDGRVPRIARLMALALRFERLVREGAVRDYAELAALGHVSRARKSQIMSPQSPLSHSRHLLLLSSSISSMAIRAAPLSSR